VCNYKNAKQLVEAGADVLVEVLFFVLKAENPTQTIYLI
jgi:hypothetical protein